MAALSKLLKSCLPLVLLTACSDPFGSSNRKPDFVVDCCSCILCGGPGSHPGIQGSTDSVPATY